MRELIEGEAMPPIDRGLLSRRALLGGAAAVAAAAGAAAPARAAVTEAERLARFAAAISYDNLAPATVTAVKRLVLDTLGCALGAVDSETARIAETTAPSVAAGERGATIIGSGRRTSASGAAF